MLRLRIERQTYQRIKEIKEDDFSSSEDKGQCHQPSCISLQALQSHHLNLLGDVCDI